MKIYIEVTECIHSCPFYTTESHVMMCDHPVMKYPDDDGVLPRISIDWRFHKDSVPDECPLKDHPVNTHVSLRR